MDNFLKKLNGLGVGRSLQDALLSHGAYILDVEERTGGWQVLFRFDNGFGASVVRHSFSYDLELAVIEWTGEGDDAKFTLTYDTPVTDDVLGYLEPWELKDVLGQIYAL